MLAAQKYRQPQDLWTPKHEAVVLEHLKEDGYLIVEPKIDGFRVMCHEGVGYSRSWTPWTNRYLQKWLSDNADLVQGWDGEMVPGLEYSPESFRHAMSGLRAEDGAREFTFFLWDNFDPSSASRPYTVRHKLVGLDLVEHGEIKETADYKVKVVLVPSYTVTSIEEIYVLEARFLEQGWEGAMVKRPHKKYKYGRATAVGGECTKVKRFTDFEAVIGGYTEAMENQNELTTSPLGYAKRSSHQDNRVGKGYLGAFTNCYRLGGDPDITFSVGVFKGWTHADRRRLWELRDLLPGRIIVCREQAATGGYDKARTPVFDRFRDPIDL